MDNKEVEDVLKQCIEDYDDQYYLDKEAKRKNIYNAKSFVGYSIILTILYVLITFLLSNAISDYSNSNNTLNQSLDYGISRLILNIFKVIIGVSWVLYTTSKYPSDENDKNNKGIITSKKNNKRI